MNTKNTPSEFLHQLFGMESLRSTQTTGEGNQHQIGIFTLPAKAGGFFSLAQSASDFAQREDARGGATNVYFRVSTVLEKDAAGLGVGERGGAGIAAGIGGLWADIDFGAGGKKNYPPNLDAAMKVVEKMGPHLRPTVIIHSGHGLQAWWMLDEFWEFGSDADRGRAAELAAGWVELVRGYARAGGWTVDSVGDLARVMRLPGLTNRKREPHVEVAVIEADYGRRYALSDLEGEVASALGGGVGSGGAIGGGVGHVGDGVGVGVLDENSRVEEERKFRLFQLEPYCADSYFRKRADKPGWSDSEYDMSLAHYAITVGRWTDEETAKLIIESRRRAGTLDKFFEGGKFSVRKLLLVIGKVRKGLKDGGAAEIAEEAGTSQEAAVRAVLGLCAGSGATEGAGGGVGLDLLSRALGVDLVGITKFAGDTHSYMMETRKGRVTGLSVEDLIIQGRFRSRIAETDGVVLKEMKKKDWELMAQAILDVVREVRNDSDDEVAELWALWEDYLACRQRNLVKVSVTRGKDDWVVFDKDLSANSLAYVPGGAFFVTKSNLLQHAVGAGFELNRKSLTRMAVRAGWTNVRGRVGRSSVRFFEVKYSDVVNCPEGFAEENRKNAEKMSDSAEENSENGGSNYSVATIMPNSIG